MRESIIPHEQVARMLAIDPKVLRRLERVGLIRRVHEAGLAGYEPAEVQRIASIVTYQRDLGVNLAGVEVILRLREQRDELRVTLTRVAHRLQKAFDPDDLTETDDDA